MSLAGIATQLGVVFRGDRACCPFHDDRRPSLYIWLDDRDVERFRCPPCGITGDVYDLVQRLEGLTFPESVSRVESLADVAPPEQRAERAVWDAEAATALVADARERAGANDGWLCVASGLLPELSPDDVRRRADALLRDDLRWGVDHAGALVMPHYDATGALTGIKFRALDGFKWSFPGSSFPALYGSWRPRRYRDVMLTEGEGDMAYALLQAPPVDVYSLPSGSDSTKEIHYALEADRYFLAFDGDPAGVRATVDWVTALKGTAREARVCGVTLGHDLKSSRPDVLALLNASIVPRTPPETISVQNGCFERATQNGVRTVTSWYCVPTARLMGDPPGMVLRVYSDGQDWEEVLRNDDLLSIAAFRRWCSARGLDCMATDSDVPVLASLLFAQAALVPMMLQSDRVGARTAPPEYRERSRSVVTPDGSIGSLPWRYTGPADRAEHTHLSDDGPVDYDWLRIFLRLNEPRVTHPLLAWLAASARRDEVLHFPILFLGGSSGSGKTTTARLACRLFGSSLGLGLSSATQFTLLRALTASTTLPVFVDEWSLQSRQDAREALQAMIPVVYEAGVAPRGRSDLSVVEYRLSSPVLCAGEDSFNLDREAERMISLRMRRDQQDVASLRALTGEPLHRFARWYNAWLVSGATLPDPPAPGEDRPAHNRAVLAMGWASLGEYLEASAARGHDVPSLPALDLSALDEPAGGARENEYEVFLREGMSLRDSEGLPLVWTAEDGSGVWVRFRHLTTHRNLAQIDVELPGRSRAMLQYFSDKYPTSEGYADCLGRVVNATLIEGLSL